MTLKCRKGLKLWLYDSMGFDIISTQARLLYILVKTSLNRFVLWFFPLSRRIAFSGDPFNWLVPIKAFFDSKYFRKNGVLGAI